MNRESFIEINMDILKKNIDIIKEYIKPKKIIGVVKANAYGHDMIEISRFLYKEGIRIIAVASLVEALKLENSLKYDDLKIFIMGYTSDSNLKIYKNRSFIFTIFSLKQALILNENDGAVEVAIKVNTGFNRLGKKANDDYLNEINKISKLENIKIHSLFSHLRLVDNCEDKDHIALFKNFCNLLDMDNKKMHICDSIASFQYPYAQFDYVRLGAALYGLMPERYKYLGLRPILSLKSIITNVIILKSDDGIGYDLDIDISRYSKVATVPIGYGDGYKKMLANRAYVDVNGKKCNVISICMDQMIIDVSNVNVKQEDEVCLIDEDNIDMLAVLSRTNKNDIVVSLNKRLSRVFIEKGQRYLVKEYCDE